MGSGTSVRMRNSGLEILAGWPNFTKDVLLYLQPHLVYDGSNTLWARDWLDVIVVHWISARQMWLFLATHSFRLRHLYYCDASTISTGLSHTVRCESPLRQQPFRWQSSFHAERKCIRIRNRATTQNEYIISKATRRSSSSV